MQPPNMRSTNGLVKSLNCITAFLHQKVVVLLHSVKGEIIRLYPVWGIQEVCKLMQQNKYLHLQTSGNKATNIVVTFRPRSHSAKKRSR